MKEFIDKLIERLEEEKNKAEERHYKYLDDDNYCNLPCVFTIADIVQDKVEVLTEVKEIVNQLAEEINIGKISDGYHTFNELYHHRAILFAVICNSNKEKAWKSKLHDTGDMYEGMFIVGIETPEGQATYHYDINPYWDMFKVKELPKAPKWDGHSPDEAIRRISILAKEYNNGWIPCSERLPEEKGDYLVTCNDGKVRVWWFVVEEDFRQWLSGVHQLKPIAWQPLPAPYTEGE